MNSFRAVERALAYEAERQYEVWQETGHASWATGCPRQTRGWDDQAQVTRPQRQKEESSDYRYFPDPDLVPVTDHRRRRSSRSATRWANCPPPLRTRLETDLRDHAYDADVLVNQGRPLVDYYVELADAAGDGKRASNWVQQDVLRTLNEQRSASRRSRFRPRGSAELLRAVQAGELDNSRGRECLRSMFDQGQSAGEAMRSLGIEQVDQSALIDLCREPAGGQPEDRRRRQGRQGQGGRRLDRPGQTRKPQRQPRPGSRNLPAADR